MIQKKLLKIIILMMLSSLLACSSTLKKDQEEIDEALNEEKVSQGSTSKEEFGEEGAFDDEAQGSSLSEENISSDDSMSENVVNSDLVEAEGELPQEDNSLVDSETSLAPEELSEITKINYLAHKGGGAVLIEGTKDLNFTKRFNSGTNQFILEIQKTLLKETLKRPFITKDFNGPIAAINAYQSENSSTARVVIQMTRAIEPLIQVEGKSIVILPQKENGHPVLEGTALTEKKSNLTPEQIEVLSEKKTLQAKTIDEYILGTNQFYGKKMSIQTENDADIRDVIRFISEESGANIVMSENVRGKITLRLRDIPWDQALIIILRMKKLGYVRQNGVLRISTLKELEQESESIRQVLESRQKLSPLRVKIIPISYADVKVLAGQVDKFKTKQEGSVTPDDRTSSLIIKDTSEGIEKMMSIIRRLDVPPPQVMIEAKIIEATQNFIDTFGINWGFSGAPKQLSGDGGASGSPINLTTNFGFQTGVSGPGNLNINLGQLDVLGNLQARIALEESKNTIKVISSPRIMALNNEKAEIVQAGQVLTKKSTTTDGVTEETITPRPFSMTLGVTPQVTASGSVLLDINLIREFPGADESGERAINRRSAKTKALVQNGQTAVIGGIFQNDLLSGESGIQGLKDIPILGWMFKTKVDNRTKSELLIFVTPRVMPLDESFTPVGLEIGTNQQETGGLIEEGMNEALKNPENSTPVNQ